LHEISASAARCPYCGAVSAGDGVSDGAADTRCEPDILEVLRSGTEQVIEVVRQEFSVAEYAPDVKPQKMHTLERRLVWELIATVFFSPLGFPAFMRPNKTYAVYKLFLTAMASLLLIAHFPWLFIAAGFYYVFDLTAASVRLRVYKRGKRLSARAAAGKTVL
jgi:hypothetical protein